MNRFEIVISGDLDVEALNHEAAEGLASELQDKIREVLTRKKYQPLSIEALYVDAYPVEKEASGG
ncbi:hypothetical protein SEA_SPEEDDEMON_1080 [Gordonia phage SpeedDemon]|uniref:Uncharacterized protein n=1 Tax=Gordonia phage Bantam TaxID=1887641 RepID=A0A1B3AYH0_9CAUD|nr:hypothetical protein BIZ77_gp073 [Gordonia phage Bantam]AOE43795.1 hypothetical protein SEA_BANTAM_106 [Gordonia phage Bantam]QNL30558.1 hypothetical protein SEA_SPEEDDEMON_1080 [Gordonia phage SpeedDemon]